MTHTEFCELLNEYFFALSAPRAHHLLDPVRLQERVDKAREAIVVAWTAEASNAERLARAGDQLCHQVSAVDHHDAVSSWWNARGGHVGNCTVCVRPLIPVELTQNPPLRCGCEFSDAWRCAVKKNLSSSLVCHCQCHRRGSGAGPAAVRA